MIGKNWAEDAVNNPNVLLVVMDSVCADRLSCYGYHRETTPEMDAFADNAIMYENMVANSSWTVPTHGTLFSGQYPSEHGAHARQKYFSVSPEETLAGQLSEAGYETVGFSTNPWISTDFGYDAGFDEFEDVRNPLPVDSTHPRELGQRIDDHNYDGITKYAAAAKWVLEQNPIKRAINLAHYKKNKNAYADANQLNERVTEWLDRRGDRPFFAFLNYMDAHEPYNPSSEYLSKFRSDDCSVDVSWHLRSLNEKYSEYEVSCVNDKYDACLNFLDGQIRQLLDELEARGVREETLVILTADHGKCLGEYDYMGVGTFLYDELVRVPLIVDPAGDSPRRDKTTAEIVSQRDIHASVLEATGTNYDLETTDGVVSETTGPHQDVTVHDQDVPAEGLRRIETSHGALVRDVESGVVTRHPPTESREELEDIEADFLQKRRVTAVGDDREMEDEVKDQLEQLGYL